MAYPEVADLSAWQGDSLAYMKQLRQHAQSVIIKLTEGSESGSAYFNPKAPTQVANAFKVFPTVGAYHYFLGNSQKYGDNDPLNEAKWFYKQLRALGFDQTTVCAIDVEDPYALQTHTTHDVNIVLKYLSSKGYTHLVVYGSASWFKSGRINQDALFNHTPIWVAAYETTQPGVDGTAAWQYTDNGHGLKTDFSYDFTGILTGTTTPVKPPKPQPAKPKTPPTTTPIEEEVGKFVQESGHYTIIADSVPVYTDPTLTSTAGETLAKGSSLVCVPADRQAHSLMISRDMYITADVKQVTFMKG